VSGQLHVPTVYFRGKKHRYLLEMRLGGLQSRSGRGGEEKRIPSPPVLGMESRRTGIWEQIFFVFTNGHEVDSYFTSFFKRKIVRNFVV
jgi:hypothetical protein